MAGLAQGLGWEGWVATGDFRAGPGVWLSTPHWMLFKVLFLLFTDLILTFHLQPVPFLSKLWPQFHPWASNTPSYCRAFSQACSSLCLICLSHRSLLPYFVGQQTPTYPSKPRLNVTSSSNHFLSRNCISHSRFQHSLAINPFITHHRICPISPLGKGLFLIITFSSTIRVSHW